MSEIRIYVACLAAYNNGILHGKHIDATQDPDEIWEEIREMLKASPIPGAEEHAIHDYEGFGAYRLSEYESIEKVSLAAKLIEEHGPAAAGWLANDDTALQEASDYLDLNASFTDAYRGTWDSEREYAENLVEEIGLPGIGLTKIKVGGYPEREVDVLEELSSYLDWDALTRWATQDSTVVKLPDYTVAVFDG